jgi:hypothetical protein
MAMARIQDVDAAQLRLVKLVAGHRRVRGARPPNLGPGAPDDPDETDRVIRVVASGDLSEGTSAIGSPTITAEALTGPKSARFRTGDRMGREAPLP